MPWDRYGVLQNSIDDADMLDCALAKRQKLGWQVEVIELQDLSISYSASTCTKVSILTNRKGEQQ